MHARARLGNMAKPTAFPERNDPQVAAYSVRKIYGRMLDLLEKAFAKQSPLFTLPMYYPLHWYSGPDKDIDPFEENRQRQVVGLIRTQLPQALRELRRRPSSSPATASSKSCSPSLRFTARATPRRSASRGGRRRTPMSWATPPSASSSSGARKARSWTTKTSSPRR